MVQEAWEAHEPGTLLMHEATTPLGGAPPARPSSLLTVALTPQPTPRMLGQALVPRPLQRTCASAPFCSSAAAMLLRASVKPGRSLSADW